MSNQSIQSAGIRSGFSVERKLLLMLFVVAIFPITILVASVAANMLQFEAIIAAVVAQSVGLALGYTFVSQIVRQAGSLSETLTRINNGDFEARAVTVTNDELGATASALNVMCDNTLNLIHSNDERDQIQISIENLNSEMMDIAAGDLTIKTSVKDDMTGSIAESVNDMTEQLRSIVQQVQSAAQQVTSSSTRIREASTTMSNDTDAQAHRISAASDQLLEMNESFQNMAELTKESAQVAVEARQTASKGLQAVSDTVEGMQRIRTQVQNTSKRIKRFGESSQEIGEIVQLISDITDRTSILALNASIQAAMAGDAGQGFAVVAQEIELLAESSKDATQQISKLIRSIQYETSEVISDMEESTREVVAGSQLASTAGETLFEIDSVSSQLVELIQTSSSYALKQAETATQVANTMSEISLSTKASAEKSREATRSVGRLADRVSQLRDSVSQFKVSADGVVEGPTLGDEYRDLYSEEQASSRKYQAVDSKFIEAPALSNSTSQTPSMQIPSEPSAADKAARKLKKRSVPSRQKHVPQTLIVDETQFEMSDSNDAEELDSIEDDLLSQAGEARKLLKKIKTADLDKTEPDPEEEETTPKSPVRVSQTMIMDDEDSSSQRPPVVRTVCQSIDADTLRQLRDARKLLKGSDDSDDILANDDDAPLDDHYDSEAKKTGTITLEGE